MASLDAALAFRICLVFKVSVIFAFPLFVFGFRARLSSYKQ